MWIWTASTIKRENIYFWQYLRNFCRSLGDWCVNSFESLFRTGLSRITGHRTSRKRKAKYTVAGGRRHNRDGTFAKRG